VIYARYVSINEYDNIKQQNELPDGYKFNPDIDKFVASSIIETPQDQSQQGIPSIEQRPINVNDLVDRLIGEEGSDNNHHRFPEKDVDYSPSDQNLISKANQTNG
jgi:hypothetical protein